jgi:transposase-like protein
LKCPLCGKEMTRMSESTADSSQPLRKAEALFYCEQHGVMNKSTDLKEKADQIAKRA